MLREGADDAERDHTNEASCGAGSQARRRASAWRRKQQNRVCRTGALTESYGGDNALVVSLAPPRLDLHAPSIAGPNRWEGRKELRLREGPPAGVRQAQQVGRAHAGKAAQMNRAAAAAAAAAGSNVPTLARCWASLAAW